MSLVVFVKIELDDVVKENYSSQICWSYSLRNYSLRIFEGSTSYVSQIPEGKIESLTMRKKATVHKFLYRVGNCWED